MREVADASKAKGDLEGKLAEMQTSYMVGEQQMKDPSALDMMAEEMMAGDPNMEMMNQELMRLQYQLQAQQGIMKRGRSREADRLQALINAKQQAIAQYKDQMKRSISGQEKSKPNQQLQMFRKEFQIRAGVLQQQIAALDKAINEKKEALGKKNEQSVELQVGAAELDQLQEIAADMNLKLEQLRDRSGGSRIALPRFSPPRCRPQSAPRLAIRSSAWAAAAGFALTCFGIAYMEFRNRRLDGPDQVDEGLGIRVVGTLPALVGSQDARPGSSGRRPAHGVDR